MPLKKRGSSNGIKDVPSPLPKKEIEAKRKRARTLAKQQQLAERIAAATAQLASAVTESSSAIEQLTKAMDQIASGAEQASGASQELLGGFSEVNKAVGLQKEHGEKANSIGIELQKVLEETKIQIEGLAEGIRESAKRQGRAVEKNGHPGRAGR